MLLYSGLHSYYHLGSLGPPYLGLFGLFPQVYYAYGLQVKGCLRKPAVCIYNLRVSIH
jgi:hypothetical protein